MYKIKLGLKLLVAVCLHWHQKTKPELLANYFSKSQIYFIGVFSASNSINIVNEGCNTFWGADLEYFFLQENIKYQVF